MAHYSTIIDSDSLSLFTPLPNAKEELIFSSRIVQKSHPADFTSAGRMEYYLERHDNTLVLLTLPEFKIDEDACPSKSSNVSTVEPRLVFAGPSGAFCMKKSRDLIGWGSE